MPPRPAASPERGQGSDCLIVVAVGIGACDPRCLGSNGLVVAHGLVCRLSLAACPYDLAGLEAGSGGEDHGLVCRLNCGQCSMGGDPSELLHHGEHLILIDGDAIPCHAIGGLPDVASDLSLGHAANELRPRGLIVATVLHTCLGGVVEELIVADPQGSVPGFVGCPAVVGGEGGSGHVVCLN